LAYYLNSVIIHHFGTDNISIGVAEMAIPGISLEIDGKFGSFGVKRFSIVESHPLPQPEAPSVWRYLFPSLRSREWHYLEGLVVYIGKSVGGIITTGENIRTCGTCVGESIQGVWLLMYYQNNAIPGLSYWRQGR
jgi:hypothetical protein